MMFTCNITKVFIEIVTRLPTVWFTSSPWTVLISDSSNFKMWEQEKESYK